MIAGLRIVVERAVRRQAYRAAEAHRQWVELASYPNTARGDVACWGLTSVQAARYHARLSRMHADTSTRFADLAAHYGRRSRIASRISICLAAVALVMAVVSAVVS